MRALIKIQYDGTNYSGWQAQPNAKSVQQTLEDSLSNFFKQKICLFSSGRTDAGVHALGQTAHFDYEPKKNFSIEKLPQAINSTLPKDISIISSVSVDDDFHARFNVKKKTYMYLLYKAEFECPLFENRAVRVRENIELEKMKSAAKFLIGEHDFTSFKGTNGNSVSNIRKVFSIRIKDDGKIIKIYVCGNGFLFNMVRIIVGTLIEVGTGKRTTDSVNKTLIGLDRRLAGETAPASGLYLYDVKY